MHSSKSNFNISFCNHFLVLLGTMINLNKCMSKWVHFELKTAFNIILFPPSDIGLIFLYFWTLNTLNFALKTMNRKKSARCSFISNIRTHKKRTTEIVMLFNLWKQQTGIEIPSHFQRRVRMRAKFRIESLSFVLFL